MKNDIETFERHGRQELIISKHESCSHNLTFYKIGNRVYSNSAGTIEIGIDEMQAITKFLNKAFDVILL